MEVNVRLTSRKAFSQFLSVLILASGICAPASSSLAASASLDGAKKEAEAKGYIFISSRDEIVSRAKQESKLRVHVSLTAETLKALAEGFTKKYPFIDTNADE